MKLNKILCILLLSLFTQVALSKSTLNFNRQSDLIPPDMSYLEKALKNQREGFPDSAMKFFKKSAKLGNNDAKYFIGMMKIQSKNWSEGYAWLKLVPAGTVEIDKMMPQIESLITAEEKKSGMKKFEQLSQEYSAEAGQENRIKWAEDIEATGTRQRGLKALRGMKIETQYGRLLSGAELERMVTDYVYDYDNVIANK